MFEAYKKIALLMLCILCTNGLYASQSDNLIIFSFLTPSCHESLHDIQQRIQDYNAKTADSPLTLLTAHEGLSLVQQLFDVIRQHSLVFWFLIDSDPATFAQENQYTEYSAITFTLSQGNIPTDVWHELRDTTDALSHYCQNNCDMDYELKEVERILIKYLNLQY